MIIRSEKASKTNETNMRKTQQAGITVIVALISWIEL